MRCAVPGIAEGVVVRSAYIPVMLQRVRTPRGRSNNAPAAFINPCQPARLGASGAKISGSDTDLMSEFSVRYF